jgi:hypothetical protein
MRKFLHAICFLFLAAPSSCIVSGYDVMADLKQEFPVEGGVFEGKFLSNEQHRFLLSRIVDGYTLRKISDSDGSMGDPFVIRFFKPPEFDRHGTYILQIVNKQEPSEVYPLGEVFFYLFGNVDNDEIEVFGLDDKLLEEVPDYVKPLLAEDPKLGYDVIDSKRDTLLVLQELIRLQVGEAILGALRRIG